MFVQMLKDTITTQFTTETNIFLSEEDDIMSSNRRHFKRK